VSNSGIQWTEDGSVYCNDGAMMRDYLVSGELFTPYKFAQKNYTQYPAFSVPYHPPGYPLLLGIWFLIFGMKYEVARFFISFLLGITGCSFFAILRRQGIEAWHALIGTLLLITSYEMVHWGRSTMSEIPAMAFLMIGTYCFIRWVDTESKKWCWLAFLSGAIAFFCRVAIIEVIPVWIIYYVSVRGIRKTFTAPLIAPLIIFLSIAVGWVKFASQFAKNEIRSGLVDHLYSWISLGNMTVWIRELPGLVGIIIIICAFTGIGIGWYNDRKEIVKFWLSWFVCYYIAHVLVSYGHFEARYFIFSIPAFLALSILLLQNTKSSCLLKTVMTAVFVFVMCSNAVHFFKLPDGSTGHNVGAEKLSRLNQPGNILLSCWNESDLTFRYRCYKDEFSRQIVRGDRTIAVRVSSYAGVPPKQLSKNANEVIDVVKQGRIRYILTSAPKNLNNDKRPKDMVLVHNTMISEPGLFTLIDKYKLYFEFQNDSKKADVFIWRFEGKLKPGNSQLPVRIPTASITFKPEF
ncbi:MAG: phospholipid carrier-dependent glycosyltransferase, partial [Candidatus Brocadiaceae bacterium]|nr:phospholipid carrier-dependent glycosyltransferase [Candidatus Brocadiaceae bacterium]